ncbi:MAG: hypothetical protein ACK521_07635 [bacterium]
MQEMTREFKNKFLILQSVMDTKKDMTELVDALTDHVLAKWNERYEEKYALKSRAEKAFFEQEKVNVMNSKEIN